MDILSILALGKAKRNGGGSKPTGTISITQNGEYNVSNYASADVDVPTGIEPTGTLNITNNGNFNVYEYANVNVDVGITLVDVTITLTIDSSAGTTGMRVTYPTGVGSTGSIVTQSMNYRQAGTYTVKAIPNIPSLLVTSTSSYPNDYVVRITGYSGGSYFAQSGVSNPSAVYISPYGSGGSFSITIAHA